MTTYSYGQYRIPTVEEQVHFGVGQPAPSLLPLSRVRAAAATKFAEEDPLFLQYGYISGYLQFRQSLASFLSKGYNKESIDPELLFATNGVSGALGLVCSLFATRGDVIVCENPSYFLALSLFRDFGLQIAPCKLDTDGLDTNELERMLRADPTFRPKFVYCIPAFHNPTGYSLSVARRAHLCCLAAEFDFMVLADEVYQLLAFNGEERPADPLCYFDTDEVIKQGGRGGRAGHVLSIGSFAKITAPGLRLGWLQVSPAAVPIIKRIYNCGQLDSSGALNPVVSGIVHTMIESGSQDEHLAAVRTELTQRGAVLGDALREHLPPGATFVQPKGGYFIWISIPQPLHGMRLMDYCIAQHKCRFHPGERFGTGLDSFIRLSFSYYSAPDLAVGAKRLGEAMRAMINASSLNTASSSLPVLGTYTPRSSSSVSATPVRVAVHGAAGRLGSLIANTLTSSGVFAGVVGRGGSSLPETSDVVIDVTLPAGTAALVSVLNAAQRPLPLIVGTTGDLPLEALTAYSKRAPVVICANFSVGVPLLLSMIASLKGTSPSSSLSVLPSGWSAEVTEIHHTAKLDSPSGTAKRLLAGLEAAGVQSAAAIAAGGGGEAAKANPIPAHALRLGDTVGVHTVYLAGPGERLELTHTATKREVFAIGAVRVATWAAQQSPGLYYK